MISFALTSQCGVLTPTRHTPRQSLSKAERRNPAWMNIAALYFRGSSAYISLYFSSILSMNQFTLLVPRRKICIFDILSFPTRWGS